MWKGNNCLREPGTRVIWSIHWYSPIILLSAPGLKKRGAARFGEGLCGLIWELITDDMSRAIEDLRQQIQSHKNPSSHKCTTWHQGQILRRWNFLFSSSYIYFAETLFPILAQKKWPNTFFNRKWRILKRHFKKNILSQTLLIVGLHCNVLSIPQDFHHDV